MTIHRASRPGTDEYPPYFALYIDQVPDGDVLGVLESGVEATRKLLGAVPEARGGHRYAAGKWSIKEVLGHMCDTERIFSYRMLAFARADASPLPSFDENAYAPMAESDRVPLAQLVDEFVAIRGATVALMKSLPPAGWDRRGVASGNPMSARAAGWIIAGHEIHHRRVLAERYLAAT